MKTNFKFKGRITKSEELKVKRCEGITGQHCPLPTSVCCLWFPAHGLLLECDFMAFKLCGSHIFKEGFSPSV